MLEANLKNSMCYRTWNDMIISLTKKSVSWCCKTKHTPEQDIQTTFDLETLEEQGLDFFINHPVLKKRKYELSSGIRSNDCRRCWETEDSSGSSARTQYIENVHPVWKNRLQNAIDNPKTAISFHNSMKDYDGTKFIEIELTNKCNMACVYCWEGLSSRWQKELKRPMPDTDDKWATTRFVDPADLRHDMHVNIVTFKKGGLIPFDETHVMEHGLYVLQGRGAYHLNKDWYEVEAGDYMWLRAFCPQSCYSLGDEPFRYLLYKDVNRHAKLEL